jgi:CO/xanthine dehydrogenase Mo-binding subunit
VEDTFRVQRQHQSYLEPKAAVASYENGRFTIETSSQYPFNVRDRTADMLAVAPSSVRVIGLTVGGGFGGKLDAYLEPYAALLARKAGRAVRLCNTRAEELLTGTPRESATITIRSALTRDGEILGREVECHQDCGAYAGEGPVLASIPSLVGGTVYRVGAARLRTSMVYTNTAPTGAMRGVGGLYTFFALERHTDRIAEELGIDRRELRLRSVYRDGDRLPNGQVLDDVAFLDAFERLEAVAPWAEVSRKERPWRGVGLAAVNWLTNPMPGSAVLKLNEDGTIGVVTGAAEIGSGAVAGGITQIVAAEFGVDPSRVVVSQPDTDASAYDAGAQGSRTTRILGNAVRTAASGLREQIFRVAADHLEAAVDDLELVQGAVGVVGSPASRVGLGEIATLATFGQGPLSATGSYAAPPAPIDRGCVTGLMMDNMVAVTYHLHLAEVEVDPDTGKVTVLRYVVVQDVGRIIDPQGIRGQVQGGVAQGLGYALWEQLRVEGGRNVERDLEAYRLPLARDVPEVELVLLEHPAPESPFGAKGVGEPPAVPVAAAIANAVSDAIGVPITSLPITPFDVLAAIRSRADAG